MHFSLIVRHAIGFLLMLNLAQGSLAGAAEVAISDDQPTSVRASGRLTSADAPSLYSGSIPDFVDYDSKMVRNRDRCGLGWRTLRSSHVNVRPVVASYQMIRAKALRAGISLNNLNRTLATFLKNQDGIPNQRYITIVDFAKRSNQKRMFTIDLKTGDVSAHLTAAGRKSDPNGDGYATEFSNRDGSNQSSLGCYMVYGTYAGGSFGKAGTLMLHGFEKTNDNACNRALIMHPRDYVGAVPGRSNGCFAVRPEEKKEIFGKVGGGGLICAYRDGITQSAKHAPSRGPRRIRRARATRPAAPVATAQTMWGIDNGF